MRRNNTVLQVLLFSVSLALSACGDGWVTEDYHSVPYTKERTAGTGVAYVRAKMAPPAGPVLEEQATEDVMGPEWVPALEGTQVPEDEPEIKDAEPLFKQETKK